MANVSIKVRGVRKLKKKFKKLSNKLRNKIPLHKRIGIVLLNEIDGTFRAEAHEKKPWEKLDILTIAARRNQSESVRILQDTGRLRGSFVMEANNRLVRVGTNVVYAPKHEFGKGVPQRKMIPSQKRGLEIAIEVTDKYIAEKIKEATL